MTSRASLRLLGGFLLDYQGESITIASQRLQSLLAYLALHRNEPQPRQRLAFLLWPDSSEMQAHTNLRTLLHRLHTVIPEIDRLLQIDAQMVAWHPVESFYLDVADFEEAIRQAESARGAGDEASMDTCLIHATSCYTGDLLPECYDEWVQPERERLYQLLLTALGQLVTLLEQQRDYAQAIPHLRRLVRLDPLNETVYMTLMRLYAVSGDRASALRVYHACVSTLETELGVAPSSAMRMTYERLLAAEAPPTAPNSTLPLIGREREWQHVQAIWQVISAGQPRLLVLSGEAGIGKTRLTEELLQWASRQGVVAVAANCYAIEGELAFAPMTTWLRTDSMRSALTRLDKTWLSEIARLMPEILSERPDVQQPGPLTEKWQRERLFEALAHAVLASNRATVLVIDDLQWASRDTFEWLHFLLRFEVQARLLVVGTIRSEEVAGDHPLGELLDALRREDRLSEIQLDRLNQEDTAALARLVSHRALSDTQATEFYAETEGNPLFIVEMMRMELISGTERKDKMGNRDSPASVTSAERLPPSVQAVFNRRLGQVTPNTRALLDVAAIIGRSFTVKELARAAGSDEDALVAALDELWQRRIVREHGPDAYDFTHDKLRSVAYAALSPVRRRMLHRRVAEALEAEHAAKLDLVSGQIAAHYEQAGMTAQAVTYYGRAALFARQLYANADAMRYLQRAVALVGKEPPPETIALYDQLGDVLHLLGRYEEARTVWQDALNLVPNHAVIACANLHRKIGNTWRDQYRYEEASHAYETATNVLSPLDDNADKERWLCWVQIEWERINIHYWLGQTAALLQHMEQIRPVVARYGSTAYQARMHQLGVAAVSRRDRWTGSPELLDHARAYLKLSEEAGSTDMLPSAHFQLGFALLWANELAEAEEECTVALGMAQRSGDISLEGRCLTYLTVIARKRQRVELVKTFAEQSLRVAIKGHMPDYVGAAYGNRAWLACRAGDLVAARAHGQAALTAWQQLAAGYMFEWIGRWPLIAVLLAEEDGLEASRHARVLLDERQQRPPPPLEQALEATVRAADAGDPVAVRAHLESVAPTAYDLGYL